MRPTKSDFMNRETELTLSEDGIQRVEDKLPGLGIFSVEGFSTGVIYKSIGLTYEYFEDNSRALCWMINDDAGVLKVKAVELFVDIKERK